MSDTQLVSRLPALRWRKAWLQIDQKQSSIEFAKTNRGVFVLHAAFITLMALSQHFSNARLGLIALTIIAIAIVPKKRVPIIVGASVFYIFVRPFRGRLGKSAQCQSADADRRYLDAYVANDGGWCIFCFFFFLSQIHEMARNSFDIEEACR